MTQTIDGQVEPTDNTVGIGTHYVRSVTYGAELVARLKFKTSSTDKKCVKTFDGYAEIIDILSQG